MQELLASLSRSLILTATIMLLGLPLFIIVTLVHVPFLIMVLVAIVLALAAYRLFVHYIRRGDDTLPLLQKSRWLRIIVPIICAGIIFATAGVAISLDTIHPTFIDDTPWPVEFADCTQGPATLGSGELVHTLSVNRDTANCTIIIHDKARNYPHGCLRLSGHMDSDTVIRASQYIPGDC